jgi:hypothetical protein
MAPRIDIIQMPSDWHQAKLTMCRLPIKNVEAGLWKISNKSDLVSHYMVQFQIMAHQILCQRLDRLAKDQD